MLLLPADKAREIGQVSRIYRVLQGDSFFVSKISNGYSQRFPKRM